MKDYKFFVLLILEFLKRYTWRRSSSKTRVPFKKILASASLIIIILLFFWKIGLGYHQSPILSQGIIGVYSPKNLPSTVTSLISESLVKLDKEGLPQPNIASSWQVNNNSTTFIFKLKDNVYWQDGSKLKAQDLKFDFPDMQVSYPDDTTIEFKLAGSFAPFPTFLTTPLFKENSLIGIGKYQVGYQEMSQAAFIKLVLIPKVKANNLPNISIRFYPDEKTAKTAFELGEIDVILGISDSGNLKNQPSVKEEKLDNFNKLVAIFYNSKDPLLANKNLRKALGFSAPKVADETQAKTSIPPTSWAYNNEAREYLNNPEVAKSYLQKANLEDSKTITLTTIPLYANLGEKIIQAWKQVGVEAILRIESGIPQNFQALLIAQPIPADPDQYTLWHSTQGATNISSYVFARVDKDLEDGRRTNDLKTRKEKYFDFQRTLAEDAPATFLYFPKFNIVYREKIEGNLKKVLPLQILKYY